MPDCSHGPADYCPGRRDKNPPLASEFAEGMRVLAVKEIHPKVPQGTFGEITSVREDINEIAITWNLQEWPFIKITTGSPTLGIKVVTAL
jgi:hypothetical protein